MHKKLSIVKHKDHKECKDNIDISITMFRRALITYAAMFQIRFSNLSYIWTQIERLYEKYIVHYQTSRPTVFPDKTEKPAAGWNRPTGTGLSWRRFRWNL